MNREDQLAFCKVCKNRELDLKQGLVCRLTKQPADFEGECPNFDKDSEAISREKKTIQVETDEKSKPGVGSLIIGILLIIRGGMRIAQGSATVFGVIMLVVGIGSVIYYANSRSSG